MGVKFLRTIKFGNQHYSQSHKLYKQTHFLDFGVSGLVDLEVEATKKQMEILAQETRGLIIDKLFAADPHASAVAGQGRKVVKKPKDRSEKLLGGYSRSRIPFEHEQLADMTIARKRKREEDGRPLIATGFLVNNIRVKKIKEGKDTSFVVSFTKREHPDTGIEAQKLALLMEYGRPRTIDPRTGRVQNPIPARPFIAPSVRMITKFWNLFRPGTAVKADEARRRLRRLNVKFLERRTESWNRMAAEKASKIKRRRRKKKS